MLGVVIAVASSGVLHVFPDSTTALVTVDTSTSADMHSCFWWVAAPATRSVTTAVMVCCCQLTHPPISFLSCFAEVVGVCTCWNLCGSADSISG